MPISGLVLSLARSTDVESIVSQLRRDPRLEVGEAVGHRLPLVSDTPDAAEDQALWSWLQSLPEVAAVNVVYIGFDDPSRDETAFDESIDAILQTNLPNDASSPGRAQP